MKAVLGALAAALLAGCAHLVPAPPVAEPAQGEAEAAWARVLERAVDPKRLLLVEGAGHRWVAMHAGEALYAALQEITGKPR